MKILEVVPQLAAGGGERFVVDLSNELAKSNDVVLYTFHNDNIGGNGFYRDEIVHNVKYINEHLDGSSKFKMMVSFLRLVKKENPDVIHYHMCYIWGILVYFFYGWRKKIYMTVHGNVAKSYSTLIHKIVMNTFARIGWLHVITISDDNHRIFKKYYPSVNAALIYNGRAPLSISKSIAEVRHEIELYKNSMTTTVFIHVARFHPIKNQKMLVVAFNSFVQQGNDAILLIVGKFDTCPEVDEIKNIAGPSIHFLGLKKNVPDYLSCSDVFCLSSLHEAMPISVIEAVNMGLAIVSTPVSGSMDVVKEGVTGYISSGHTPEEFCQALSKLYLEKESILKNAKMEASNSQFTMERCAKYYIDEFAAR